MIGLTHKLGKQNRQKPGVTHGPLNTTFPTYLSHDNSNENIYVASEEPITVDKYSNLTNDIMHTMDDLI